MVNKLQMFRLLNVALLLGSATCLYGQDPAAVGILPPMPVSFPSDVLPANEIPKAPPAVDRVDPPGHQPWDTPGTQLSDPSAVFRHTHGQFVDSAIIVGGEFLYVRPHFSEAIAFASLRPSATGITSSGRELDFDYQPSFRAQLGYRMAGTGQTLLLTYWNFDGDVDVDGRPGPAESLVDPFGNRAVPAFAPVGVAAVLGGDAISTRAEVDMDVLDIDMVLPLIERGSLKIMGVAGARVAWVDQYYESIVTIGGAPFANGDFSVDFTGAGPHLGANIAYALDRQDTFNIYARTSGSLLVGEYDVNFNNTTTLPPLRVTQVETLTKTIPVLEAEMGLNWRIVPNATISAGWMFQSWFDLGTSGGTFGGFFNGADDANIMSFEGLTVRAQLAF